MWIRTQDKEMIMNCNAVGIGLEEQTTIWSGGYVLGTYSTKEKALKVLDMIEDRINQNEEQLLKFVNSKEFQKAYMTEEKDFHSYEEVKDYAYDNDCEFTVRKMELDVTE